MCNRRCCSGTFGIFLVVVFIVAWATPWHFYSANVSVLGQTCTITQLEGWQKLYCSVQGSSICEQASSSCPSGNWRSMCGSQCDPIKKVYDTTAGLFAVAFICGLITSGALLSRGCTHRHDVKRPAFVVIAFIGFIFTLAAISYYAANYNKKVESAYGGGCPWGRSTNPSDCDSFFGSYTATVNGASLTISWGGAGWIAGVFLLATFLVSISLLRAADPPQPQVGASGPTVVAVGYAVLPDAPVGSSQPAQQMYFPQQPPQQQQPVQYYAANQAPPAYGQPQVYPYLPPQQQQQTQYYVAQPQQQGYAPPPQYSQFTSTNVHPNAPAEGI